MIMPWTTPRVIATLAFSLGLLLLVLVAGLAAHTAIDAIHSSQALDRSRQVLQATREYFSSMQDAETGQRGYLITGLEPYLNPYLSGVGAARLALGQLDSMTEGDLGQHARVVQLSRLTEEKLAELERTVELRRRDGFEAARAVVLTDLGLRTMQEIRLVIATLSNVERTNLNGELAAISSNAYQSLWLNASGLGLALVLSIIGFATLRMEARQREGVLRELSDKSDSLKRSNAELERFAYVASHDLQEPLRMVSSYTQLLGRRYKGKLGAEADEFIGFAVDGAKRMQELINDLLDYSRVTTRGQPPVPTDASALVKDLLGMIQFPLAETGGQITVDPLPTVLADPSQLRRVFQNLISNGLKFRKPDQPPHVHVSAAVEDDIATFTVRDNGIGIDPQFFDRLFLIFQRLHTRAEYPGTGIGLAICKRVVEHHGGRIWVDSAPGVGSAFHFTLPVIAPSGDR